MKHHTRLIHPIPITVTLLALLQLAGCGFSGGQVLFMSGLFKRPTIEARFKLSDGPIAVLVDDFQEHCYWTETVDLLADAVIKQLRDNHAAAKLIPSSKVRRLRQSKPDFDERGCREIGRFLDAHQVLWLEVRSFYATVDPVESTAAARFSVAVKVINALEEKDRHKVRLWPKGRSGELIEIELSGGDIAVAKTRPAIARKLAEKMAQKVVASFHDRPMPDFDER